ncbi:hypothetical protein HK097_008203 [Rhizophlyctis rosea]|uniref:Uncharacterized protein n=1 Tax=Rhizophlyctis rosea TaxID=64517 RepID=A0AAD5SLD4_9FUNG|nr:hypothetical protein HK097_008203 [Rhizophlyctis rosea]
MHTIESFLAIDLFDSLQSQNIDGSGSGSLPLFLLNIQTHGLPTFSNQYLSVIESSSTDLEPSQLREVDGKKLGCFRIFSIDGGHTETITLSDLVLVQKVLCDGGVIIIDDWTNDEWFGVRSGIFRHFNLQQPQSNSQTSPLSPLAPFLAINNKLYLTTPSYHDLYFTTLQSSLLNGSITYLPLKTDLNGFPVMTRVEAIKPQWDLQKMWEGYLGGDGGEHWRWGE